MMIVSLAFIFLLTPLPSLQASIGERKNSTKPTPHAINLNDVPKPVASEMNSKTKLQSPPTGSKVSNVSQTSAKPAASSNVHKASMDKPPMSSTITVIISEGCVQKEPRKDAANMTKIQEVELSVMPGSPLAMTHRISLEIGTCGLSCETEIEALKGRVEFLEKEMSDLKKKYSDKTNKLNVEAVDTKVSESSTDKEGAPAGKKTKADKALFERVVDDEELREDKKTQPTAKPNTTKPITATTALKDQHEGTKDKKDSQMLLKEEKSQEQATKSKATVVNVDSEKQLQTNVTLKVSTKQEATEKLSKKKEKLKDFPVNQNVTQSTEKKSNGTSKVLPKLSKSPKANVTSSEKGKLFQTSTNMSSLENERKLFQSNTTVVVKGTATGKRKVEKHGNGTISIEKNKPQLQSNAAFPKDGAPGKKKVEKNVNVTSSVEKDKKVPQVNATVLKDEASIKRKVEEQVNAGNPTVKDKAQTQSTRVFLKEGSSEKKRSDGHHLNATSSEKDKKITHSNVLKGGKKTLESQVNVTASIAKDKKLPHGGPTMTLKEVTSGKRKVERHVNVTSSVEKDKKPQQVEATLLKEEASGRKKVEKHRNTSEKDKTSQSGKETLATSAAKNVEKQVIVTLPIDKDKPQQQGNATLPREGKKTVDKYVTMTSNIEKDKKLHQVNASLPKEEAFGKRSVEKHTNVMTSTEKDKTDIILPKEGRKKDNVTVLKAEAPGKKKVNTTVVSDEKSKKQLQGNVTTGLGEKAAAKEKLESHGNGTAPDSKEKILRQGGEKTVLGDGGAKKKKAVNGVNVMVATEKDKSIHVNQTTSLKEGMSGKAKVVKHANGTVTMEKGKLRQVNVTLHKETPGKKKVDATKEKDKKQLQGNVTSSLRDPPKTKVEGSISITNAEVKTAKIKGIESIEVQNITATGFIITWEAPRGAFKNFTVTRREVPTGSTDEEATQAGKSQDDNDKRNDAETHTRKTRKFSHVLPGSARSYHFRKLQPQTRYLVSVYSSRAGGPSKLHRLFVTTGPEPPTDLQFSNITETSASVSWTKPLSSVTGFRVLYTNAANGETGSMSVDSQLSHVLISKLSAGSSYDISIRSVLEAIESEPTTASVITVPDPPTGLQAVNITDTKALLTWKPSRAKVDHYILSYGSAKSTNVTVTVMLSGSSVEHQLRGLHRFTLYTVRLLGQINNLQSRSLFTIFTTTSGVRLQSGTTTEVTFNSAVISWKAPRLAFRSYRLTYQHGEDVREVILNPTVTRYELTDLVPFSNYTVKVDGESEGQYISVASTAFTTAQVPFPYPTDCSQVQLNGVKESGDAEVYPEGRDGEPAWVYCDMDTDGGGWTVFQRRADGSTDFFRGWKDYSKGFGFLNAEFWLGNSLLHNLTSLSQMTLRIDLRDGNDTAYAHYSNFSVGSEANHYAIAVSGYSGTAGDSMRYHNGRPFSTKDKDPNPPSIHCAKAYLGGWWYKNCYKANLNGLYATFSENQGVVWIDWKGKDISIPFTEMKLRPASLSHVTTKG